jgi:hypothetical protein
MNVMGIQAGRHIAHRRSWDVRGRAVMAPGRLAAQVALVVLVFNPGFVDSIRIRVAPAVSSVRSELSREGLYPQSVNAASAPGSAASRAKKAAAQAPTRKAAAGKATSYAFETVNSRGEPARWDTCATIPVVVDTVGAPAGVIADLRTALALVNAATGLRLTITATANRALTAYDSDNPTTPVLVGFASGLSGVFGDAGVAGLTSTGVMPGTNVISGATIAFNTDLLGTFGAGYTGDDPRVPMFAHEFAHLAGLDHVPDPSQLMYPDSGGARLFGAGDLAGLRRLATPGCTPTR